MRWCGPGALSIMVLAMCFTLFTTLASDLPHDKESTRGLPAANNDGTVVGKIKAESALRHADVFKSRKPFSISEYRSPFVNVRIVQPHVKAVLRLGVGAAEESVALTEHTHLRSYACRRLD